MNQEEQSKKISQILAKCWSDESFKQKLLKNTAETLKEEGFNIPSDCTVQVLENTEKTFHFVLPLNPNAELSDSALEAVSGGEGPRDNREVVRQEYHFTFPIV